MGELHTHTIEETPHFYSQSEQHDDNVNDMIFSKEYHESLSIMGFVLLSSSWKTQEF